MKFIKSFVNKKSTYYLKYVDFYYSVSFILFNLSKHFLQTNFSLKDIKSLVPLQKIQFSSNFFNTIELPSIKISIESFCSIFSFFLISFGITILPS